MPESRSRVLVSLDGLHPTPHLVIREGDRFFATVALGFERERVAVVVEDASPRSAEDPHRLNRLTLASWQVVVVAAHALRTNPEDILAKIHYALRRATSSRPANPTHDHR